jgi:hypothetical protein
MSKTLFIGAIVYRVPLHVTRRVASQIGPSAGRYGAEQEKQS